MKSRAGQRTANEVTRYRVTNAACPLTRGSVHTCASLAAPVEAWELEKGHVES